MTTRKGQNQDLNIIDQSMNGSSFIFISPPFHKSHYEELELLYGVNSSSTYVIDFYVNRNQNARKEKKEIHKIYLFFISNMRFPLITNLKQDYEIVYQPKQFGRENQGLPQSTKQFGQHSKHI